MGRLSWFDLPEFVDPPAPLWLDGHSTYHGGNDKIPIDATDSVVDSLKLAHVDQLAKSVFKPGEAFGNMKRRVQGQFTCSGSQYSLWVTDPVYERRYLAKLDGECRMGECFVTVSLGEQYGGAVYKLIAAIITAEHGPCP